MLFMVSFSRQGFDDLATMKFRIKKHFPSTFSFCNSPPLALLVLYLRARFIHSAPCPEADQFAPHKRGLAKWMAEIGAPRKRGTDAAVQIRQLWGEEKKTARLLRRVYCAASAGLFVGTGCSGEAGALPLLPALFTTVTVQSACATTCDDTLPR